MLKKAVFFLALFHLSAILSSCWCDCDSPDIPFSYDIAETVLLDNTTASTQISASDTLGREAVAFRLLLSGVAVADRTGIRYSTFGYQQAYALSCDCTPAYVPKQQITKVTVVDNNSGEEVTKQFVALTSRWNSNGLYLSLAEALDRLPQEVPYEAPGTSLDFFLTEVPAVSQLSYSIEIQLSDGRMLTTDTPTIHLP